MDVATTTAMASDLLVWISNYGYLILLPLFIIEGPAVGIASGVLVSFGVLKLVPVFILYVAGTLISDSVLYFLARDGEKYLRKISLGRWAIDKVDRIVNESDPVWKQRFRDNYFSLMVFARLTPVNLVSEFVVLIAGTLKIPPRKFYAPVVLSQPIWAGAMLAIGYYFGDVIADPGKFFTEASLVFVAGICLFILYRRYMHQYLKEGLLARVFNDEVDGK